MALQLKVPPILKRLIIIIRYLPVTVHLFNFAEIDLKEMLQ